MRRVKCIASLGLVFLSLGITTSAALGRDNSPKNQADWDMLKQLSAGQEIRVVQYDAKSRRGNFRSVTDEAIVVTLPAGEQTISRQNVLRVSIKSKGHRRRNALIGASIGAGAGLVTGLTKDNVKCTQYCFGPATPKAEVIGAYSAFGAITGAIIGSVVPTGGWHEIYRASAGRQ